MWQFCSVSSPFDVSFLVTRVAALPLVSVSRLPGAGSQVANLQQETRFPLSVGMQERGRCIYLFSPKRPMKVEMYTSWMFVFCQGQSTNLLFLKKLWQKSDSSISLECNMTLFFKNQKTMGGWWNSNCRLKCVTVTQKLLQFLSLNYLKIS